MRAGACVGVSERAVLGEYGSWTAKRVQDHDGLAEREQVGWPGQVQLT